MRTMAALSVLSLVAWWAGCSLMIESTLSNKPVGTTAVGGAGGTGAGGAGAGGGQGGSECTQPDQCPGEDTTCRYRTCTEGECGVENAPAHTPCTEDDGLVCDGSGDCVECVTEDDCAPGEACDQEHCVPAHCIDDEQSGNETDVDCGGDCLPCVNGLSCLLAGDCESRFCDTSAGSPGTCSPCGSHDDCLPVPDTYCDGGVCVDRKTDSEDCLEDRECLSSHCVDAVCCGLAACAACEDCNLSGNEGTCAVGPDGAAGDPSCDPYLCNGIDSGCPGSCGDQTDCAAGNYCDGSNHCVAVKDDGAGCVEDFECSSGQCVDLVCCDTSCGATCQACTGTLTGGSDGTCAPVLEGLDPDGDCASNQRCNGLGSCTCGWDIPPTSVGCPAPCNTCSNGVCSIVCSSQQQCTGTINCPVGFACSVTCSGDESCQGGIINCPADHACNVQCSCGGNSERCCQNAQINCSQGGLCNLACGGGTEACDGTDLGCGDNQCEATCTPQTTDQPTVTCNTSCSCVSC